MAARCPGFQLSAPHALAPPGAAAHARVRGPARRAREAELSRSRPGPARGKEVVPGRGARPRALPALCGRSCLSMASHQQSRIQAYLEKNKIGPLFEVRRCGRGRSRLSFGEGVRNTPQGRRDGEQTRGRERLCEGQVSWNSAGRALRGLPERGQVRSGGPSLSLAGEVWAVTLSGTSMPHAQDPCRLGRTDAHT